MKSSYSHEAEFAHGNCITYSLKLLQFPGFNIKQNKSVSLALQSQDGDAIFRTSFDHKSLWSAKKAVEKSPATFSYKS